MEWGGVFNVARYLTDSLRGPVLQTLRRAHEVREFDGTGRTDGTDGLDGHQKCPLIFFILRLNTILIYTYIYKSCPGKFLVGLKFWTSWGSG